MPLSEVRATTGALPSKTINTAATTFSNAVDVSGAIDWVSFIIKATAPSGTPSLTLSVQWSNDGGTTWYDSDPADSFAAITGASNVAHRFSKKAALCRLKEVFTGAASSITYQGEVAFR